MTFAEEIPVVAPLVGGALIGLSVAMMLMLGASITGVSGILGNTLKFDFGKAGWRPAFLLGLLLAIPLVTLVQGQTPEYLIDADLTVLLIGGLFVGVGTRIGNGCTSGHGVCGIANLSPRSLVATATFMGSAAVVVYITRHVLV